MKIEFKDGVRVEDLHVMTQAILMIMIEFLGYCNQEKLPCKVTSLIGDFSGRRVSRTHEEGRAFDASVTGWSQHEIDKLVLNFNLKYKNVAAISYTDLKPRLVVYHDSGYGDHLHFQVKKGGRE